MESGVRSSRWFAVQRLTTGLGWLACLRNTFPTCANPQFAIIPNSPADRSDASYHAINAFLLLLASPVAAQYYTELDMMADQVRARETSSDFEFSPRLTVGYQWGDVNTRLRYWHLDSTYADRTVFHDEIRNEFDILDLDAYKQWDGIRLFGGLRTGDVQDIAGPRSPFADGDGTTVFGPTAGAEGETPLIGCLSANYGVRASVLLADWYVGNSAGHHVNDTLFVPEIYTGLDYRWNFATIGAKFEIQHWRTDYAANIVSPTIVGIGATASVAW
jgi:hypothetical protein